MLVLTRRTGESIMIGDEVVVTVLDVRSDQVRIGIQAPRSVKVQREELLRRVEQDNAAAAASAQRAATLLGRRPPQGGGPQRGGPQGGPAGR